MPTRPSVAPPGRRASAGSPVSGLPGRPVASALALAGAEALGLLLAPDGRGLPGRPVASALALAGAEALGLLLAPDGRGLPGRPVASALALAGAEALGLVLAADGRGLPGRPVASALALAGAEALGLVLAADGRGLRVHGALPKNTGHCGTIGQPQGCAIRLVSIGSKPSARAGESGLRL